MDFLTAEKAIAGGLSQSFSHISGLSSPLDVLDILNQHKFRKKSLLVLPDEDSLDLFLQGFKQKHFVLRSLSQNPYSELEPSAKISPERLCFLHHALNEKSGIFVCTYEALVFQTLSPQNLKQWTKKFEYADTFFKAPNQALEQLGYVPTQFVEQAGQYSNKGGLIDVFSPAHSQPVRIELFGDEIESLRHFSPLNQRSSTEIDSFALLPAHEALYTEENQARLINKISNFPHDNFWKKESLHKVRNKIPIDGKEHLLPLYWPKPEPALNYFKGENTDVFFFDINKAQLNFKSHINFLETEFENGKDKSFKLQLAPSEILKSSPDFSHFSHRLNFCSVLISDLSDFTEDSQNKDFPYTTVPLKPSLDKIKKESKNWNTFSERIQKLLKDWTENENKVFINCPTKNSLERAKQYLKSFHIEFNTEPLSPESGSGVYLFENKISKSVKYNLDKLILLKYSDLFNKENQRIKSQKKGHQDYFERLELLNINDLSTDDLVVHAQHGVGVFKGLKTMNLGGCLSECMEIHYSGKDKLFLPVHKINLVRKYSGNQNTRNPDKLGSNFWIKTTAKVKSKLKDIANDLIELYAKRKLVKREALPTESSDILLFQNQFPFEETPDQTSAISDIYSDYERDFPMDRLICGDVGFGKTEVAMRAAFACLNAGKQVAVLAPTTVLSLQHLRSFEKRFEDWPFVIKGLNRFISRSQVKETLSSLKAGTTDMIIGTHRVLSQDVEFKNLGLLIVDEEQKFGVKQKEKIKSLKSNIDILSLSATPIPRTLNMGFLGVRDLSLISTPPKDRLPIKTLVSHYSGEVIKQAIETEIKRGGQVYFVHNRVQSIYNLHEELKELMPDVRVGLGHGQMSELELERVMLQFFNKEIDVLLSTTIVESGMDISNANTIIINNAQNFGLSQLYQLRGRVGRSERRAFCYLLIPPNRDLEKDQKEKLKVLQDHTALGSGLQIAHHDLEIRGAGNLVGESQSGHAEEIGYEFYLELLEEAIAELKGDQETLDKKIDPDINISLPALIPSDYIKDFKTRLFYYRKLNRVQSEEALDEIESELRDQFGKLPNEVLGLFFFSITKALCKDMQIKDLKSGPKNLAVAFTEKPNINVDQLLQIIKKQPQKYKMAPDQRLLIQIEKLDWPVIFNCLKELKSLIGN